MIRPITKTIADEASKAVGTYYYDLQLGAGSHPSIELWGNQYTTFTIEVSNSASDVTATYNANFKDKTSAILGAASFVGTGTGAAALIDIPYDSSNDLMCFKKARIKIVVATAPAPFKIIRHQQAGH
jgi:hypothetical protein